MSDHWKPRDFSDHNNKDYCFKWSRLLLLWERNWQLQWPWGEMRPRRASNWAVLLLLNWELWFPPPSCWSCPPGIPSPTGWETGVVSVRLCSSKTGPGSDSCVSPERSRRSRRRRRVPVQPYLLFLSPLLFHPVLKLQLSSHNNSSSSGEAGKHTTSSRKTRARLRWRLSFRDELRAALRCDAALFLEKKS